MKKTTMVWSLFGIQVALFVAVLFLAPHVHKSSPMQIENWIFWIMIGFLILGFFYMGVIIAFAALRKPNEDAAVKALFDKMDTNKDMVVSKKEALNAGMKSADFDRFDRDRDGQLSHEEFYEAVTNGLLKYTAAAKAKSVVTLGLGSVSGDATKAAPTH